MTSTTAHRPVPGPPDRHRPVPAPTGGGPVDDRFTALVPGGSGDGHRGLESSVVVGRFGPAELHVLPGGDGASVDRVPASGVVSVIMPLTGRIDVRHRSSSFSALPTRSLAVLSPGSPFELCWPARTASLALCVDGAALAERLDALLPARHHSGELRFTPQVVSPAARDVVAGTVQLLVQAAAAPVRLARLLGSQTLDTLLLGLPHDRSAALVEPARTVAASAVRDTVDRIAAEREATYTVGELAALASVSLRTLEAGFRGEHGCTPLQYLRAARLSKAHEELVGADPESGITVGHIAGRWGFFHLGRFAAAVRERHGESPSEALRRR